VSNGGKSVWSTLLAERFDGLGLKTIKGRFTGLGSKLGWRFRGGTDDTWHHRGVRVEAKLLVRRRGGRQINVKTELDLYAIGLIGLALIYPAAFRECKITLLNRGWQPPCLLTSLPFLISPLSPLGLVLLVRMREIPRI
jgi:hypothetical protein